VLLLLAVLVIEHRLLAPRTGRRWNGPSYTTMLRMIDWSVCIDAADAISHKALMVSNTLRDFWIEVMNQNDDDAAVVFMKSENLRTVVIH
jgi:hypothetical protein